jgi:quercetin dioxygenase-like cupin family protein
MDNNCDVLIDFEHIDWEIPSENIRYKTFIRGNQQIRLLEFLEGYEEKEWCTKGHSGYVLEGEFAIYFKTSKCRLKAGDIIHIPVTEEYAHKAILKKGENVQLLLFELS